MGRKCSLPSYLIVLILVLATVSVVDSQSHPPAGEFTAISAGHKFTCAIKKGNDLLICWGRDGDNALDYPSGRFKLVACGGKHSCAISASKSIIDTLKCWGKNEVGQATVPASVASEPMLDVASGWQHSCAIRKDQQDRSVVCWGSNEHNQTAVQPTLAGTNTTNSFLQITCGGNHTCGIHTNRTAVCWGDNLEGQAFAPQGIRFTAISAGWRHTCAVREDDGSIMCWGSNEWGQLAALKGQYKDVAAGGGHTCGLLKNGALLCWGDNVFGQADSPVGVYKFLTVGGAHSCAHLLGTKSAQSVYCWGYKEYGSDSQFGTAGYLSTSASLSVHASSWPALSIGLILLLGLA